MDSEASFHWRYSDISTSRGCFVCQYLHKGELIVIDHIFKTPELSLQRLKQTRLKKKDCYLIRQDNTINTFSMKLCFSSIGQEK